MSSTAPVAYVVVRLTDVAPDGTSSHVTTGILNLTHRDGHDQPKPLAPNEVYEVHVQMKAAGYRFLPGQRIRLSIASQYWPVIFPSPYPADNFIHRGAATPSRLILPVVPMDEHARSPQPPQFKTTPPELIEVGSGSYEEGTWQIVEDVIKDSVTVKIYDGDTTILPDGTRLFEAEKIDLTAYHHDPAHAQLVNEVDYRLNEHGYQTDIRASGSIRAMATKFHIDVELQVKLNGQPFFQKAWLESVPRMLV